MRKLKIIYWIFTLTFAALTILFAITSKSEDRASIILSGVALMTSSIALGLSDQKKNYFKGEIKIWSVLWGSNIANDNSDYRVSMHLINKLSEPIYDVVYRLRLPSSISVRITEKNSSAREYKHGKSIIIIDDSYGFLGTKGEDQFIPIDIKIKLSQWKESNIYITISGSNISPTTFSIPLIERQNLIAATSDRPIYAKPL